MTIVIEDSQKPKAVKEEISAIGPTNLIGSFVGPGTPNMSRELAQNNESEPKENTAANDELGISGSETAFLHSKFRPLPIPRKSANEIRLSRRTSLFNLVAPNNSPAELVAVNTAYKRKADKVKPLDLGESTGETPGGLANWKQVLWRKRMENPQLIETDPPHKYDDYIIPRISQIARGARLSPERIERLQIGDDLLPNERELLLEILQRREEAIAWNWTEVRQISEEVAPPQRIRTVEHKAWQSPSFPIPKALNETVIEMLKDRINQGVFEPCNGPYRNPWFLVKKKSGKYRIVNAAMKVNEVTVRDANLPPNVDSFAEDIAGQAVSSLMDFFSGYDQVSLHPESRDMTAFQTPLGLLRQTTLPMGATNSVGQFQRIMAKIFEDLMPKVANPFIDDIIVNGPKTKYGGEMTLPGIRRYILEHLQNLDQALFNVELAGGRVSGEKSQWCVSGVSVVGFVCDYDGRHPDSAKVAKIVDWPPCKNITEARAFIGVCVYYRIWIKGFAVITIPIYMLFRKGQVFVWGEAQIHAMNVLKIALTMAPALRSIDYSIDAGEIICAVDSSGGGWGGTLMQIDRETRKRHPIRYESGIWSDAERKYDAGKLECRAVLKMLKKCRSYLYGVHFVLELDANTLVAQLNRSATDLPGALVTRWIAWIRLFDFTVRHVPGSKHTAADGLLRRPKVEGEDENEQDVDDFIDAELNSVKVCMAEIDDDNEEDVLGPGYSKQSQRIARFLTTLRRPNDIESRAEFRQFKKKALKFLVQGNDLFRRDGRQVPLRRVVDSEAEQRQIIQSLHDESGHRGREGTYHKIAQRYWWEGLYQHVGNYVKTCVECQLRKPTKQEEELHPTWTSTLWEKVAMDVFHMPPNLGKNYVIMAREDLSGWPEARALAKNDSASVAKFLYEDVICRHGCFSTLVNDGGPETRKVVEILTDQYKIKQIRVSPYHPQANGMIEAGHKPVKDALSKLTHGGRLTGHLGWVNRLSAVLLADRVTVRVSTGMTPFQMLYGRMAILPIELQVPTWQTLPWNIVRSRSDLLAMRARQIERRDADLEEAKLHLQRMRIQNKELYDETKQLIRDPPQEGDLVLLYDGQLAASHSGMLQFRWLGPYRVRSLIADKGTYFLEELDGTPLEKTYHGSNLKRFWLRESAAAEDQDDDQNDEEIDEEPANETQISESEDADGEEDDSKWIPPGSSWAVVI
jgi:hypothetical protein